ncbi:MAG: cytochrome c maturation protein CcmE domain-containing protein [Candidatus Hodarchaeales archaeon]|jgi:cytochrome c-type biogenesis protein CcmE
MAISTPKMIGISAILVGALAISAFLVLTSFTPQYSINELFEKADPNDLIGKKVQLVGDVQNISDDSFLIEDWEGNEYSVLVEHENIPIPSGFETGKRVLVEGSLEYDSGNWVLKASQISTKCPSKYQSQ